MRNVPKDFTIEVSDEALAQDRDGQLRRYVAELEWKRPADTSRFGEGVFVWINKHRIVRIIDVTYNNSHGSDLIEKVRQAAGDKDTQLWLNHVEEMRPTIIVSRYDVLDYKVRIALRNAPAYSFERFSELITGRAYIPWSSHTAMHGIVSGPITVHGSGGHTGASSGNTK